MTTAITTAPAKGAQKPAASSGLRPLSEHPEWAAANQRLQELRQHVTELDRRISGLAPTKGTGPLTFEDMAEAMADGKMPAVPDVAAMQQRYDRLYAERKIAMAAVVVQERRVAALQGRLSVQACEEQKARHQAIALDIVRAARAMAVAMAAQRALFDELGKAGFDVRLGGVTAGAADWYEGPDASQTYAVTVRDAIEAGGVAENDPLVPQALRDRLRHERRQEQAEVERQAAVKAAEAEREAKNVAAEKQFRRNGWMWG